MRRASVGDKMSEGRTSMTYNSNATSIQVSLGGDKFKKVTPMKTNKQFETLDINKIKKQK